MQKQLSVSQLNNYIKGVFDDELILQSVNVCGEIFEFKITGGNSYIVLKENDAILNCVYFSSSVDYPLGANVMASGSARYYHKGGKLSFVIKSLRVTGDGEIVAKQRETKNRLEKEGIFSNNRPLKAVIQNIALITSSEGAVLHDFLSILQPLNYVNVAVFSVSVQGEDSANDIISTINRICGSSDSLASKNVHYDVIVIARGGGSNADLDEFNNENLARAVYAANIPVISAVGHETNTTLCDFAADYRAGTPSIAAEMIVNNNGRCFQSILRIAESIKQKASLILKQKSRFLYNTAEQTIHKTTAVIDSAYKKCVQSAYRNQATVDNLLLSRRLAIKENVVKIQAGINMKMQKKDASFRVLCAAADRLSPMRILSQGYGKVTKNGAGISSVEFVNLNDGISIVVADGEIDAVVNGKQKRQ